MPRPKRPLADADANAAPEPKRVSTGSTTSQGQENTATDYSKQNVTELTELLKARSLPYSGKKQTLVRRLADADIASAASSAPIATSATSTPLMPVFECFCRPAQDWIDQQNEEDEDFDEDDLSDVKEHPTGCGTSRCKCGKSPSESPEWKWVMSTAGAAAATVLGAECIKRDQDMQHQYLYNDFSGYGFQEAMENHLVDIDRELNKPDPIIAALWPKLEALAFAIPGNEGPWFMSDCSMEILYTLKMIGGAVICTLKVLERQSMLKVDSNIKNIALVLGHIRMIAQGWPGGPGEDELSWVDAAIHKALKHGIEFKTAPYGVEEAMDDIEADDEDVEYDTGIKWSKFDWKKEFAKFKRSLSKNGQLGGDHYDLTKSKKKNKSAKKLIAGGVAITLGLGESIEDFL